MYFNKVLNYAGYSDIYSNLFHYWSWLVCYVKVFGLRTLSCVTGSIENNYQFAARKWPFVAPYCSSVVDIRVYFRSFWNCVFKLLQCIIPYCVFINFQLFFYRFACILQ